MGLKTLPVFILIFIVSFGVFHPVSAEDKNIPGGIIPKLSKTSNDPELLQGRVYPNWGPPCQRYIYSVIYRDKEGRAPEYVKIYFNGQMIEMNKENPADGDYRKGVKYIYQYVPNKVGSNFYYFEASNGRGKARASIIDSPDNGPVLFESAFDKNEIALVDPKTGKKVGSYPTGKEWVGGIALSDDGKYLAAKTSKHIYLFDASDMSKPLWNFACEQCRIGDDVKGGIAITGNGSKIFAAFGERVALFNKTSNKPLWMYAAGNSYNVAISKDGKYMAAATAGEEANVNSNLVLLWEASSKKPLWQYHAAGNFHDVSLSDDGRFIAGSTGCPDRRFYLFSKDSGKPLIRTEPLTRDSPVHRAKLSAAGTLAAVGSEADAGAVFLFSKDKRQVWKFPTPQGSSVRALNFTPDGQYIGAATFGGNAYIFAKEKNRPLASWQVAASLGGVDVADDGSFIAAGGTDNKLYIFERDTKAKKEILFSEYLEEVDIAANGKYIAAGTGGSVYFFETYISQDRGKTFDCSTVIEPPAESETMAAAGYSEVGEPVQPRLCGEGKCAGPETAVGSAWLAKIFGMGLLGSLLALGAFWVTIHFHLLKRYQGVLIKHKKRIVLVLLILTVSFSLLTLGALAMGRKTVRPPAETQKRQTSKPAGEGSVPENRGDAVCGNNMCEPDLGETKEACPQDCSAGD